MSLDRALERQAGVVTLGQAVATGMSADTVRRRVRDGRWCVLHPTVYLVGGHRLTGEAQIWPAWLWAGDRSTVSGPAAFRHGMLREAPGLVDVTVPAALHRRTRSGVRFHRRDLDPLDRGAVDGLALTTRPLTALETAPRCRARRDPGHPGRRRMIAAMGTGRALVRAWHPSR